MSGWIIEDHHHEVHHHHHHHVLDDSLSYGLRGWFVWALIVCILWILSILWIRKQWISNRRSNDSSHGDDIDTLQTSIVPPIIVYAITLSSLMAAIILLIVTVLSLTHLCFL